MKVVRWKDLGIRDAAAAICAYLNLRGIEASLVGGACVSIYSDNAYESFDLDFVSHDPHKKIKLALAEGQLLIDLSSSWPADGQSEPRRASPRREVHFESRP